MVILLVISPLFHWMFPAGARDGQLQASASAALPHLPGLKESEVGIASRALETAHAAALLCFLDLLFPVSDVSPCECSKSTSKGWICSFSGVELVQTVLSNPQTPVIRTFNIRLHELIPVAQTA